MTSLRKELTLTTPKKSNPAFWELEVDAGQVPFCLVPLLRPVGS
jgi:hypothetical protein